jgi:hypothetical protein
MRSSEISVGRDGFDVTDISRSGPLCSYRYLPEDSTYAVLYMDMSSQNTEYKRSSANRSRASEAYMHAYIYKHIPTDIHTYIIPKTLFCGGRSVGIICWRTKAPEFFLLWVLETCNPFKSGDRVSTITILYYMQENVDK